ncbi:MAG: putative rane protein [Lachnospiraceae bacterium]|jgi:N-acetylmuramoyl-L-alanine amidase|nr:putative rane protein [Lachnospiraceae bacterium]
MLKKGIHGNELFHILFLIMVCVSVFFLRRTNVTEVTEAVSLNAKEKLTVIIDAGHGGKDPGKVGINNALEKDINLNIALKLKKMLELNDINVIMIREDDRGLYSESDSNKKAADMRKRVEIINNSGALIAVSIHQNSYTGESIKGAQVFYYGNSAQSKQYAEIMQEQLKKSLQDGNKRVAKANENYYMLKKTEIPIVIVECGFLSNYQEADLLIDEAYQEKLAWSIHLGMMTYINKSVAD